MVESFHLVPGCSESQVLLHIPHSSQEIPDDIRADILLNDDELREELLRMTDAHTEQIASLAAKSSLLRPHLFINRLSRLVIDPERFIDGTEVMDQCGMGAVYTKTSQGSELRRLDTSDQEQLIERFFAPYSQALTGTVQQILGKVGTLVIIDVHSFPEQALPYELVRDAARPEICLGTDPDHTPSWLINAAMRAFAPLGSVKLNAPFQGTYVPLRHYKCEPRVLSIMVEYRRDQYMDESIGEARLSGTRRAAGSLTVLIDAIQSELTTL